jgi:hypothetical protein
MAANWIALGGTYEECGWDSAINKNKEGEGRELKE